MPCTPAQPRLSAQHTHASVTVRRVETISGADITCCRPFATLCCREHTLASTYGYSYMEFWTDGGRTRPVTCGHMPQTMKCEVISSGKVPSWHSSEHTQKGHKWYKEPIYSYDDYKINGRAYAKTAAYEIDDADSSAVSIASVAPQGAYYSHVFPLSELKGTCNTYGLLGRLDSACWNKAYKPKPKEVELGVKLTMDDYYTCPKHSDDILPLVCYVRDSLQELLYKHGIEGKIKVAPVECKVRGRVAGAQEQQRRAGRHRY